jgi:nitrite reductase/ring-hydroxylating ferredoxin subunit
MATGTNGDFPAVSEGASNELVEARPGTIVVEEPLYAWTGPGEGEELLPGIRQIDISEEEAIIPGYARVAMRDIVIELGATIDPFPMENDMVCHMLEGELEVIQDASEFTATEGYVWTCAEGTLEGDQIICPRHGAHFCIKTGEALTPPAYEPIVTFPVRVENGIVQVCDDRWD